MKKERKPRGYWKDKENCRVEALKYEYRNEFRKGSREAYVTSLKNGWMNEFCSHMIVLGDKYKRLIYSYEFGDNSVYVGLTNNHIRRHKEHTKTQKTTVKKYITKNSVGYAYKILTDYLSVDEAIKKEHEFVVEYKNNGWNILNKCKSGGIGKVNQMWDFESCKEEALKYSYRTQFKKGSPSAYVISIKNGWADKICIHMVDKFQINRLWDFNSCFNEALKYGTKSEFYKKNQSAYNASLQGGWLDTVCKYMCGDISILDSEIGLFYRSYSELEQTLNISRYKLKNNGRFLKV